jgi:hypothetical protein
LKIRNLHIKIPKGWRQIRVGEVLGRGWKYYHLGMNYSEWRDCDYDRHYTERVEKGWNESTIYIKKK